MVWGDRLGLELIRDLLEVLGRPQDRYQCVLVAGTNGKGSTATTLATILRSSGLRTGLYTSPHLECVEERLRVEGWVVESSRLAGLLEEVITTSERELGKLPTYFEALTAAAFLYFARQEVAIAVLEVGLGGRFDATNVCEPVLSLITEIDYDHTEHLGESLEQIAGEKAGIVRPDRPVLSWNPTHPEVRTALEAVCLERGGDLRWSDEGIDLEVEGGSGVFSPSTAQLRTESGQYQLRPTLLGEHQLGNMVLAVRAAEVLARNLPDITVSTIEAGVAATNWPGRLEPVRPAVVPGRQILLDGAHNPGGARSLSAFLERVDGPLDLLFGALQGKRVESTLSLLRPCFERITLTMPPSDRAVALDQLATLVPGATTVASPLEAFDRAWERCDHDLVVCGSLYLVGEIRPHLRRRFATPESTAQLRCG